MTQKEQLQELEQQTEFLKDQAQETAETIFQVSLNHLALETALVKKGIITEEDIEEGLDQRVAKLFASGNFSTNFTSTN